MIEAKGATQLTRDGARMDGGLIGKGIEDSKRVKRRKDRGLCERGVND